MPNKKREEMAGGVSHVYPQGNRRQPIFLDDDDRAKYLLGLEAIVARFAWELLAWCLMTTHTHLLIRTPTPTLGIGLGQLHSAYVRYFNRKHGLETHLLRRPSGSKLATDEATVRYWATYVALNPVRAGMVDKPEEYRWSSYAATLRGEAPEWVQDDFLVGLYGSRKQYARTVDAVRLIGPAGFDPVTADLAEQRRMGAAGFEPATPRV